jgi:hypothetical protein
VSETIVYYSSPSHLAAAEQVLRSLSGSATMGQGRTTDGADVTVVTGSNFTVNSPPSQGAGAPSGSGGTSSSPSLAAPTAPTQNLAPFDPRSCTATGGEGK